MSLEKFNLNMLVPEDGGEKDPELKRLTAELFTLKQPMEDAITKQNLPLAEEIFAQIEEAKKKLDEYKESLNKKEQYPTIEINGTTIELGPILNPMKWDEIPGKLEEFNKTLKPGEKPWRVPSLEEFEEIGKTIREVWENSNLTHEQRLIKAKEKAEEIGFIFDYYYWSSTSFADSESLVWCFYSKNGFINGYDRYKINNVRLIR